MEGFVTYFGEIPKHVVKLTWVKGKKVTLKDLKTHVGVITKGSVQSDTDFSSWLKSSPLTQDNGFFIEVLTEEVKSTSGNQGTKIFVESERVVAASSLEDAQNRLKHLRDSRDPGTVERDDSPLKTNKTRSDKLKKRTPLGNVTTGDDFKGTSEVVTTSTQRNPTVHLLNESGQPTIRTPTSKEEQVAENVKMSSLSNNIRILTEESFSDGSYAVVGKDAATPPPEKKPFIGHAHMPKGASVERSISLEDITSAPDLKECFRFIDMCKDPGVLRIARSHFAGNGQQKQVEYVERKLRTIRFK